MKLLLSLFFISSCTNFKHATSTNLSDVKHFKNNNSEREYWNQKVSTLLVDQAKNCKLVAEVKGKDNVFDQGAEFAVLYMKINAHNLGANAILVKGNNSVGNYGNEAYGDAYLCNPTESK